MLHSDFGMNKVDIRRFRRAVNGIAKAQTDNAEAQAAAAAAESAARAAAAAAEEARVKAEEEAAAAAKAKAEAEERAGPPKWKLLAMAPELMLREVIEVGELRLSEKTRRDEERGREIFCF